jgi:hypothetical protein
VVVGKAEREVLVRLGLGPDFDVTPASARAQVDFIHRRTAREDIYFLRNTGTNALHFEGQFRVRGGQPEIWDAVHGTMTSVAAFQETPEGMRLALHLPGHGSVFVVFTSAGMGQPHLTAVHGQGRALFPNRPEDAPTFSARRASDGAIWFRASTPGEYQLRFSDGSEGHVTVPPDPAAIDLDGPWEVRFPRGWDVPVRQEFSGLQSWTDATNAATRAFSGISRLCEAVPTVRGSPCVPPARGTGSRGRAGGGACILNGREAGLSSFAPHVLDVTGLVRPGENSLLVEVANTWLNRLIADDALPEVQRKTHVNLPGPVAGQRWRDAQPKRSGLLGPVRLRFPREIHVNLK